MILNKEATGNLFSKKMKTAKENVGYLPIKLKERINHELDNRLELSENLLTCNPNVEQNIFDFEKYVHKHVLETNTPDVYLLSLGLRVHSIYPLLRVNDINEVVPDRVITNILKEYFPDGKYSKTVRNLVKYIYLEYTITKYHYITTITDLELIDCLEVFPFKDIDVFYE